MEQRTTLPEKQMSRQPWEEPAIVLERSLEVKAQVKDPLNPLGGFLGPLSTSAGACT